MRIILLRQYNPFVENGASANRFRGLIDGLCQNGHSVTIGVTGGFIKQDEKNCSTLPQNCEVLYLSRANHFNGVLSRLNLYFFRGLSFFVTAKRLNLCVKQRDFDIIWLTNNGIVLRLFLQYLQNSAGKSFIELNEFNDIYKEEKKGNFLQRRAGKRDSRIFVDAVGKIDLFAVMTKTLMSYYKQMAKPSALFMHLPMTVDLSRFSNIQPTSDDNYIRPYIAFTGTMNNQKDGVDVLIKAFARIADKYPTLHLYLAGFWHYDVPDQETLIAEFGLNSRIHYVGILDRDQIPSFISNATLLALSRPDSHQAQGGFPTKLGEYLATGNPVCVTKVGEIPDYLEDNESAFLAAPGDVDSFAEAIDKALRDETNAKRVGKNGRRIAEASFDVVKQSERLANFLHDNL